MKATPNIIVLKPTESFTCVDWRFGSPRGEGWLAFHAEYLLVAIIHSRGTRYLGDSVGPFRDGDLFLLGPKVPHYWVHDVDYLKKNGHVLTATFADKFLGDAFAAPEAIQIRQMLARSSRALSFSRNSAARVIPDLLRVSRLTGWPRLTLFLDILGRLAATRTRQLASPGFSSEIEEKDLGRLSVVCKYVHDFYAEEILEKKVAALIGLSPAPFSRYFRQRMGRTFVAYINEVRIGEACQRLEAQDSTIVQIAFETGFNHLSNFNRIFQKLRGMTPSEYRHLSTGHSRRKRKPAPATSREK